MIYNVTIHDSVQTQSTGFRQTPPDSTGFRQTPPDSARLCQTPPDSTRLHQILLDSAGLWWTTVCDRMSHYVTNLLLFVTYTGVRWSRWGSVKYCVGIIIYIWEMSPSTVLLILEYFKQTEMVAGMMDIRFKALKPLALVPDRCN